MRKDEIEAVPVALAAIVKFARNKHRLSNGIIIELGSHGEVTVASKNYNEHAGEKLPSVGSLVEEMIGWI